MPIRESIQRSSKPRSGIAIGGIGTGSLELRKDGIFRNWSIFNNEPLFGGARYGFAEDSSLFFLVRWQEEGRQPQMKLLQIDEGDHPAGALLQFYTFPWMSGVDRIESEADFPTTRLRFVDAAMPFELELEAFSPFVPGDLAASTIPGCYFRFQVRSRSQRPVRILLMASLRHLVGYDVRNRAYAGTISRDEDALLVEHHCTGMDESHASWGQMCLASLDPDSGYHAGWSHRHTFHEPLLHQDRLPDVDSIADQNAAGVEGEPVATHECISTVGRDHVLEPGAGWGHDFVLSWYFPNCYSDLTKKDKQQGKTSSRRREGHWYENSFTDATAVARHLIAERDDLIGRSLAFQRAFRDSTLPERVLDQINVHLNTFVASSWFTKSGDFGIQEGWTADQSWGPLATIDVGMYGSPAAAYLFPELDRSMWEVHRRLQFPSGDVCHGIGRNFGTGDKNESVKSRLDLAIQYSIMLLRHCFLTDDRAYLQEVWPSVVRALRYTLEQRDQDGDGMPEMEGSMSTYDNFPMYGPASLIVSQLISALQYGVAAAELLEDGEERERLQAALDKARAGMQRDLWNGSYFSLSNDVHGEHGRDEGCLTDQIIGQWASHMAGLGDIVDRERIETALDTIMRRNWEPGLGVYNCRWPEDDWLHPVAESCWFDQSNTNWTGVELAFASLLLYEGRVFEAEAVITAVDERYRAAGRAWDHQEWGGHYYRGMSAWAILNGYLGLSVRGGHIGLAPKRSGSCRLLLALPGGWGHFERSVAAGEALQLKPLHGSWTIRSLSCASAAVDERSVLLDGAACPGATATWADGQVQVCFEQPLELRAGQELRITT
ncbi:MAG: GH116 family glycosyl hydrolase [Planctomycetota bacterium]